MDLIPFSYESLLAGSQDAIKQLGQRSKRIYENDIKKFAQWLQEADIEPQKLTRSHMIDYRTYLLDTYEHSTAQRMLSVAHTVIKSKLVTGELAHDPMVDIRAIKVAQETTHTSLSKKQARDLLDAVDKTTKLGTRDYTILLVLLRTGIRRFECSALNIGDIGQEQGHYIATIRHGKGDKRSIIKLPNDVFRDIQAYIEADGRQNASPTEPIFTQTGTSQRLGEKTIERIVKKYGEAIGVPSLTPHGLRATFVTLALEGNASLHQVQYAVRHADPRTTERYHTRKLNLDDNAVDYVHI